MVQDIEKVSLMSMDIEKADLEKFRSVFPQCFSEGKLDISKLLALFGQYDDNDFEKYKFEWKGKSECYRIAGRRSTGTLRPCPKESVDFENTKNMYIEGDNLEVLKLLQSSYYNKVKMIYIDPPYNTGNDFVYEDDFKDPMAKYKEITEQTTKSNPETMGRFHTNWLNMMYPRLRLAANLLRDDGVIFISIDDNEVTNLRKLCDEVFGEENFVAEIIWKRKRGRDNSAKWFSKAHEYLLIYSKNKSKFNTNYLELDDETKKAYKNPDNDIRGDYRMLACWARGTQGGVKYDFTDKNGQYFSERLWLFSKENLKKMDIENKLIIRGDNIYRKLFIFENKGKIPETLWDDVSNAANASDEIKTLFEDIIFDTAKPIPYIKQMLQIATKNNDIILDFFSGSATTAHAVMQLNAEDGGNRQFICVQLPELCNEKSEAYKAGYKNICEIGKERIRRAGAKIKESSPLTTHKLDTGFKVFKLDTSNLTEWDSTPTQDEQIVAQRFSLFNETIKTDRSDLDVVYEVMLRMGIPLDYKVIPTEINDKKAYSIGDDCLVLVCLDYGKDGITPEDIKEMCELVPAKIVSSEQAFKDSSALSNAYYILKDKDIEMKLL